MSVKMERRVIPFSPPDIGELEIAEVAAALKSGWITTGPRTKLLERRLAAYIDTGTVDSDCTSDRSAEHTSALQSQRTITSAANRV